MGDFFVDKEEYLSEIKKISVDRYVNIYDGYIPDHEVGNFFVASDLVILPYISATQSGIIQLAYAFERPVIVTNVGGLPEIVENCKTGYIVSPANSSEIADSIINFYTNDQLDKLVENIRKRQDAFSWDTMVGVIEELAAL